MYASLTLSLAICAELSQTGFIVLGYEFWTICNSISVILENLVVSSSSLACRLSITLFARTLPGFTEITKLLIHCICMYPSFYNQLLILYQTYLLNVLVYSLNFINHVLFRHLTFNLCVVSYHFFESCFQTVVYYNKNVNNFPPTIHLKCKHGSNVLWFHSKVQ